MSPETKEEIELDNHINHAGRLLLNHRYIEDTIKTQNKTFLDNPQVKNIINKMWYGSEQLNFKTVWSDLFTEFDIIFLQQLKSGQFPRFE